jgi:HAD superfamily hydrolase (TIGR01549 family)
MTDITDIKLIIFDTDGTIIPSLATVYEGIRRAFAALGWELRYTPDDINYYIGTASGEMYQNIIPPEHAHRWEELREKSRAEYADVFRESAETFPGVKDTLAALRKRGYHLVLYSNASSRYFNIVIESLGIRDYFDYTECVHDSELPKPELVRKIRKMFGDCPAAVVGDRDNDIEAARETGSLSVGVLFGYGGDEPREADLTISEFTDLLEIFDKRLSIFQRIEEEIRQCKSADKPFVVGVTGIDAAGKTRFAGDLERYLAFHDYKIQMVHLDDFHNPRAVRYSGENPAENYYDLSFNLDSLLNDLLRPLREHSEYTVSLPVLNLETDAYDREKEYRFDRETIVIMEGVFLFRKELAPHIDYTIYLDIAYEESLARGQARNTSDISAKYASKYHAAQKKYLAEYPPEKQADIILDNSNWDYPSIINIR